MAELLYLVLAAILIAIALDPKHGVRRDGANFARRHELASFRDAQDGGALQLGQSRNGQPLYLPPRSSLLVVGPTQSGKTTNLVIPAIRAWRGPVLAASVKSDLLVSSFADRQSKGPCWVVDPGSATGMESASWSPLERAQTRSGAKAVVADLLDHLRASASSADGEFWQAIAGRFLAPLLQAAALSGGTIDDVVSWIDGFEVDLVASILASHHAFEAEAAWLACCSRDERLIGSALATALTVIEPIAELGGGPALRATDLLDQSGSIYLCAPIDDQRRYAGLFVSIIRDVLGEVGRRATREARAIHPPLLLVLDEATAIAPLAELDSLAATLVGQGVTLVTVVQDLAQLRARYGPKAETIVSNHAVRVFLPGIADLPSLELLSALAGERSYPRVRSRESRPYGLSRPASPGERRPLITSHELRTMPRGEAMVLAGSLPVFRLRLGGRTKAVAIQREGRQVGWGLGHYASRVWKSKPKSQCSLGQRRGPLLSRWTRSKSSQA